MRHTPETTVKNAIRDYLVAAGHFHRRMHCGSVSGQGGGRIYLGPPGTADFLCCLKNRAPIWLEVKADGQAPDRKRDEEQAAFAEEVRELGHWYAIVKSADEVAAFLGKVAASE